MRKHFFCFYRNEQYALKSGAVGWKIGKEFRLAFHLMPPTVLIFYSRNTFGGGEDLDFSWFLRQILLEKNLSKQSLLSKSKMLSVNT